MNTLIIKILYGIIFIPLLSYLYYTIYILRDKFKAFKNSYWKAVCIILVVALAQTYQVIQLLTSTFINPYTWYFPFVCKLLSLTLSVLVLLCAKDCPTHK
jgi:hypothetical protein